MREGEFKNGEKFMVQHRMGLRIGTVGGHRYVIIQSASLLPTSTLEKVPFACLQSAYGWLCRQQISEERLRRFYSSSVDAGLRVNNLTTVQVAEKVARLLASGSLKAFKVVSEKKQAPPRGGRVETAASSSIYNESPVIEVTTPVTAQPATEPDIIEFDNNESDLLDADALAEIMVKAAKSAIPFCEVCSK